MASIVGVDNASREALKKLAEEEIQANNEKREKQKDLVKEEILRQRKAFLSDDSLLKRYESIKPKEGYIIVKVFQSEPPATVKEDCEKAGILVPGETGDFNLTSEESKYITITNTAKVLASGSDKYKPGDNVILPYHDVFGIVMHPDWETYYAALQNKGMNPEMPATHIPKYIRNVDRLWDVYRYIHPEDIFAETSELTFIIPDLKVDTSA